MHAADTYSTCYSHSPLCVVERGRSAAPRLRPAPCMHCSSLFLPTVPRQAEIANHCTETHVAMRGRVRSIEACPRRRCAARFGAHGQTESGQARPGPVARPLAACRLHACTHVLASEGGSGQLAFAACTLQYHRLGQDRTPALCSRLSLSLPACDRLKIPSQPVLSLSGVLVSRRGGVESP